MEIKYVIEENIGILSEKSTGWAKELNIVNWNDKGNKFDIREWDSDHKKMSKGITLTEDELLVLYELLKDYFHETTVKVPETESKSINDMFFK